MIKKLLFFCLLILPALGQPVCTPTNNCVCDQPTVAYLRQHNWIVVPWSTGDCYFHNVVTREDRDTLPNLAWPK